MNYNRGLREKLFDAGWSAKELSAFWKKHGIERKWGTVLNDLREGTRVFSLVKFKKRILIAEKTAKEYVRYMLDHIIKNHGKTDEDVQRATEDINRKTKEVLAEKMMNEENEKDIFKNDTFSVLRSDRKLLRNHSKCVEA